MKFCDVPIVLQLISLEDLCASRYISWKNAVLCSCLLLLNDLVVSLAVMPYSSYDLPTEQKMLSICTSRHPKQLWTGRSFRMPSSSSSEWAHMHLLILTLRWVQHFALVLFWCWLCIANIIFSTEISIKFFTALLVIWLLGIYADASHEDHNHHHKKWLVLIWLEAEQDLLHLSGSSRMHGPKSGSSIEISSETLLLLRNWQSNRY